jgi:hypothetical protein
MGAGAARLLRAASRRSEERPHPPTAAPEDLGSGALGVAVLDTAHGAGARGTVTTPLRAPWCAPVQWCSGCCCSLVGELVPHLGLF